MAYNKMQPPKLRLVHSNHAVPISPSASHNCAQNEPRPYGQISRLFQRIFSVFTNKKNDKDSPMNKKLRLVSQEQTNVDESLADKEKQSLHDLENCANATRKAGICSQSDIDK